MDIPIFLLHGLNSHPISLYPLRKYLNYIGYINVYNIKYNPNDEPLEKILDEVDSLLMEKTNKEKEIIVIGQSIGGLVANNLHRKDWKIKKAIYVGSPLHGAKIITYLDDNIPIWKIYKNNAHNYLSNKEREQEPNHDYHTISCSWLYGDFDGCVYKEETMLSKNKHSHINFSDHRLCYFDPRLWWLIKDKLK